MDFIAGQAKELPTKIINDLLSYRYKVFVEKLGWELDTRDGLETDEFDHDDTIYVVAKDSDDHVTGCARLLPTTRPYLLEQVFPELLNGLPAPKSDDVWELSRFTSMDLNEPSSQHAGQLSSPKTAEMLMEAIRFAKESGAKRMISVSPLGVERLLRSLGIKSHRAGPPQRIDGYLLIACWIDLQ